MKFLRFFFSFLILSLCLCSPAPKQEISSFSKLKKPDVLWIVLDSFRGDLIGRYGVTDELEKFSSQSYVFKNHLVNSSWTRPSTLVFFTGKYASRNPVNFWDYPAPKSEAEAFYVSEPNPLPKVLKEKGMYTVMVGNNPFLTDRNGLGVDVGFESLNDFSHLTNDTPVITRKALDVVSQLSERKKTHPQKNFFFFLNFNDPHKPYTPPPGYDSKIKTDEILDEKKRDYLGEVAYVDDQLKIIFDTLKEKGLWDNTLILITADHGEVMNFAHSISPFTGTNTYYGHGQDLFLENIHVPLLLKLPHQKDHKTIVTRTRSIDIYPTILEVLGLKPRSDTDGKSLIPVMNGSETKDRMYYGETRSTQGIGRENHFLLQKSYRFHELGKFWEGAVGKEVFYYYDIQRDPDQVFPFKFFDISEVKDSALTEEQKRKIEALWKEIRKIEPKLPIYHVRINRGANDPSMLSCKVLISAGQIRMIDSFPETDILQWNKSPRSLELIWNSDPSKKGKTDFIEFSFEVYPDVSFPNFSFFVNGVRKNEEKLGIGSFDLSPNGCYFNCESLFDAPIGSPEPSSETRMQIWRVGANKKEYSRADRLETDALEILRKQGYVQ
ncbi:sulfatase [Leptospira idonii]|uniref:sulfatase n=1 Tax=Leptospira idonii TaxID=1193500 RepID=UPI001FE62ABA|nr:sulfatase [Leptospira idonii]